MASLAQWVQGARPRTLPNAIAPVLAGWGAAAALRPLSWGPLPWGRLPGGPLHWGPLHWGPLHWGPLHWGRALLALVVALALVIGVNYANDYSDGIRGTDADRVGPIRLVGSGAAGAGAVRATALVSFAVALVAGLVLVALTGHWWLLGVGVASVAAAWYYTGGRRPYGYLGLGELAVFVFFGPVAVLGTQYVLSDRVTLTGALVAVAVGALSAAVLVTNNLRDIPTDAATGKRTLAVRLGPGRTAALYAALVTVPFAVTLGLAPRHPATLAALIALAFAVRPLRGVLGGAGGPALIPVLRDTALTMLVWAAATGAGLAL